MVTVLYEYNDMMMVYMVRSKTKEEDKTHLWVIKYETLINVCIFRLDFLPVLLVPGPILCIVRVERRVCGG
jgi:hypothetical protein